eukprot:TRINITY_DN49298_c0_g1_i1.p1 TRINITY_DN49298_c0_g1~~TRINITY_DN49298_c0_g1_i1.p1  ORF type:complete len:201 (-),score=38.99 TRINITY_DN49298_c0_g1_i1:266-790(-)
MASLTPATEGKVAAGALKNGKRGELAMPPSSAMLEVVARVQAEQAIQALDAAMAAATLQVLPPGLHKPLPEQNTSSWSSQASTASGAEEPETMSRTNSKAISDQAFQTMNWTAENPWLLQSSFAEAETYWPSWPASGSDFVYGSQKLTGVFEPGMPAYVNLPSLDTRSYVSSLM